MKKSLLITLFVATAFFGCSTKDDPGVFTLVGKTYSGFNYSAGGFTVGGIYFEKYDAHIVYRFLNATDVEYTSRKNNANGAIIGDPSIFTYNLDYPSLKVTNTHTGNIIDYTFIDESTIRRTADGKTIELKMQ